MQHDCKNYEKKFDKPNTIALYFFIQIDKIRN